MRFDYETKEDDRECVAYIDEDGDLIVREDNPNKDDHSGAICMMKNGNRGLLYGNFNPSEATHKFYPGDKITIEF